jgi:hypothetical protein
MTEESLFSAALEKADPAERDASLDRACAGDAALRQRLRQLLAAHQRPSGVLDRTDDPAAGPPSALYRLRKFLWRNRGAVDSVGAGGTDCARPCSVAHSRCSALSPVLNGRRGTRDNGRASSATRLVLLGDSR